MRNAFKITKAVTLLELSTVLLIIGFLVSVVTVGSNMIQSGKLRQVAADILKYQSAIMSFKTSYGYYPGDYPFASSTLAPACSKQGLTTGCNGNGDNRVSELAGENLLAWLHLAGSKSIQGEYTGVVYSGTVEAKPGINVPAINFRAGAIDFLSTQPAQIGQRKANINGFQGKILTIAAPDNFLGGGTIFYQLFTDKEASDIDKKIDDGYPSTGNFHTIPGNGGASAAYCLSNGKYYISSQFRGCIGIYFIEKWK